MRAVRCSRGSGVPAAGGVAQIGAWLKSMIVSIVGKEMRRGASSPASPGWREAIGHGSGARLIVRGTVPGLAGDEEDPV